MRTPSDTPVLHPPLLPPSAWRPARSFPARTPLLLTLRTRTLAAPQRLASSLPYAKHTQSKLRCAVTRELMSDANPPLVLPNGLVYSTKVGRDFKPEPTRIACICQCKTEAVARMHVCVWCTC